MTQDGNDKKKATLMAPMFNDSHTLDLTLAVNEMTTLVPKAASQSKDPIFGVILVWSTESDAIMIDGNTIHAVEAVNGAKIVLSAASRGIKIEFTVNVLNVIKRIELASGQNTSYVLPIGGTVDLLTPVAYDAAEDGREIDGAEELITWVSNMPDVVSVDGNTLKAESTGKAEITAQGQGVTSKGKVTVTVTGGVNAITHVLNNYSSSVASRTRILQPEVEDVEGTTEDESVERSVTPNTNIDLLVQVLKVAPDGKTSDNDASVTLTVRSQNTDVIAIPEGSEEVSVSAAQGTITINTDWIMAHGTAYLVVSLPGANDLALPPIMINKPAAN